MTQARAFMSHTSTVSLTPVPAVRIKSHRVRPNRPSHINPPTSDTSPSIPRWPTSRSLTSPLRPSAGRRRSPRAVDRCPARARRSCRRRCYCWPRAVFCYCHQPPHALRRERHISDTTYSWSGDRKYCDLTLLWYRPGDRKYCELTLLWGLVVPVFIRLQVILTRKN